MTEWVFLFEKRSCACCNVITEMSNMTLTELIEATRNVEMTPAQVAAQRQSFVYGNCKIENDNITREIVADADERLSKNEQSVNGEKT